MPSNQLGTHRRRKPSEAQAAVLRKMQTRRKQYAVLKQNKENEPNDTEMTVRPIFKEAPYRNSDTNPDGQPATHPDTEGLHAQVQWLRKELDGVVDDLHRSQRQNQSLGARIEQYLGDIKDLHGRCMAQKMKLYGERRKTMRARRTAGLLRTKLHDSRRASAEIAKQSQQDRILATCRTEEVLRIQGVAQGLLDDAIRQRKLLEMKLATCRRELTALRKRCARFPSILEARVKKARSRPLTFELKHKGVYTSRARLLARFLVQAGCAQTKVGELIQLFGRSMGCVVKHIMSSHTVRRAVLEGGCASDIQLAHEMRHSEGFTISGDGTSHRRVNYEARHMLTHVPAQATEPHTCAGSSRDSSHQSPPAQCADWVPKNRTLGVASSVDHTSETQLQGWQQTLHGLVQAYNQSPLAQRDGGALALEDCITKLAGMSGDHASDQLKTHGLVRNWKREMTYLVLGRDRIASGNLPTAEAAALVEHAAHASVESAGGHPAWDSLSPEHQWDTYACHFQKVTADLGRQVFEALPDAEKQSLDLFLRLGCMMHKDLNAVKGGNAEMMMEWSRLAAPAPILLANKENASTLQDVDLDSLAAASSLLSVDDLSAAELRALGSSTRGGVKLTSLEEIATSGRGGSAASGIAKYARSGSILARHAGAGDVVLPSTTTTPARAPLPTLVCTFVPCLTTVLSPTISVFSPAFLPR
ncbi:hypothetical protein NUW54_g1789 [Trametes sanguinea]|uniref:Uncharacterized protein n=1 Tax=Trametes sanguinea TaxID=158606 RepID=A0ACC1Q896_9APHY|nr:hypothetical protein NUW54_g1789 [Trametes sanguinea]